MYKNEITIGVMGTDQIQHIIPILYELGYQVVNIQDIWSSDRSEEEKEKLYREAIKKCDILYNVYTGAFFWAKASYAKLIGKKVITHWIGTDVLNALTGKVGYLGHSLIDHHLVCYEPLKDELHTIEIESTVLPIIPFSMKLSIGEMPDTHAVLIYLPETRPDHYGYEEMCYVFESFPDLKFHIVAHSGKGLEKFSNVIAHGWISEEEMEELYKQISIVIRFIKHDGLSMTVIEGLVKGKKVIWNNKYHGVIYADSKEAICRELAQVLKTAPCPDIPTSDYVKKELSKENFKLIFNNTVEKVLSE